MRVLHVITGLNLGGAEGVLFRLCTFPQRGCVHQVVSLTAGGAYAERLAAAGVPVHSLDMPRGRLTLSGLTRLYRLVRTLQPDIVQTWLHHGNLVGGVVARLAGHRHVAWGLRTSYLDPAKTPRRTLWVLKACALLSRLVPSRILCCSESAKDVHVRMGFPSDAIVVVPNGYCCERFEPNAALRKSVRYELDIDETQLLIGMVARYDYQKDHANLLDALSLLVEDGVEFTCLLVGTGMEPANTELASMIAGRGLSSRVRCLGPREDITAIMNALDLHVLSSAFGEAFPNVVAESMACGTPCVVTDVGDAALIAGEAGWVVPPANSGALAEAILAALKEQSSMMAKWRERQRACRARIVDKFSLDRMVGDYESIWRQVLRKG